MSVDWSNYDAFDWSGARQAPMTPAQREAVEVLAADRLELSPAARQSEWGGASPPGRFAAAVIHVAPGVEHVERRRAQSAGIESLGVKVFKTTADARREARKVVPFHQDQVHRFPGLPNERVQKSLAAGMHADREGVERLVIIQEWVDGESLETLIRRRWAAQPIDGPLARSLLEQLLGGIIIPLWAAGTIWWDVRDANYCHCARTGLLKLIDVDSLAAYSDEILGAPQVWTRRDKGRRIALARLRQFTLRVLLAQGLRGKKQIERTLTEAWDAELAPSLSTLGKPQNGPSAAPTALHRFLDRLAENGAIRDTEALQFQLTCARRYHFR